MNAHRPVASDPDGRPLYFVPAHALPRQHYTGTILQRIRRALQQVASADVALDQEQQNAMDGVHQARVRLADDPTVYRLILAPADAPITLYGRLIGDCFAEPIGDAK